MKDMITILVFLLAFLLVFFVIIALFRGNVKDVENHNDMIGSEYGAAREDRGVARTSNRIIFTYALE